MQEFMTTTQLKIETSPETSSYQFDFQPTYPNPQELTEAKTELLTMDGITTNQRILILSNQLASIALGHSLKPIVITGRCMRPVSAREDIRDIAFDIAAQQKIVASVLPDALYISRDFNQDKKPRTDEFQETEDGQLVPSFYGDGINGLNTDERTPDPTRMVAGSLQARDVMEHLDGQMLSAHEALLVPFEEGFIRVEGDTQFIASGDLLWVGDRTRHIGSPQVELLKDKENPVGIKLGPSTTPEEIEALYQKLNPKARAGKIVFMLRLGTDNLMLLPPIIRAIKEKAPGSLILSDPMHGNTTKTTGGRKTRIMRDMIREMIAVQSTCNLEGVALHGLHLEASGKNDRLECVDKKGDVPRSKSLIDPELNNDQLRRLLRIFKNISSYKGY